ncbi:hypothetical protein ACOSQ3_016977 [Xanthoceras sorbifolium]
MSLEHVVQIVLLEGKSGPKATVKVEKATEIMKEVKEVVGGKRNTNNGLENNFCVSQGATIETEDSMLHGLHTNLHESQRNLFGIDVSTLYDVEVVEDSFPTVLAVATLDFPCTRWKRVSRMEGRSSNPSQALLKALGKRAMVFDNLEMGNRFKRGKVSSIARLRRDLHRANSSVWVDSWSNIRRLESKLDELLLQEEPY